jgi:hypothetical protein
MVADSQRSPERPELDPRSAKPGDRPANDLPMSDSIFTRLSGRKRKRAAGLIRFVIVAVIIAIIGLVGLYFATGPHR